MQIRVITLSLRGLKEKDDQYRLFTFGLPRCDGDKYFSRRINGWWESSQELTRYMQSHYDPIERGEDSIDPYDLVAAVWWDAPSGTLF